MANGRAARRGLKEKVGFLLPMTIEQRFLELAAKVGSVIVPGASLERYLSSFSQPLFVWTHDEDFPVSIRGSATLVAYKDRYYAISTMHQLAGIDYEDVCLMTEGSNTITSGGSRCFTNPSGATETDAYDIVAFDFTEPVHEGALSPHEFFSFDEVPPDCPNTEILVWLLSGYPSADQDYDLYEARRLETIKRVLFGKPSHQSNDEGLLAGKFHKPLDFPPDGMSGGPVFTVQVDPSGRVEAYFGGLILRAGQTHFHFLKSGFVRGFLDSFLE